MAFNSAHLSDSAIKDFIDRLMKHYKKTTVEQWPPKRHQVQESVAAMLGYTNWHALSSQLSKSKTLKDHTDQTINDSSNDTLHIEKTKKHTGCQAIMGTEQSRQIFFNELINNTKSSVLYVTGGLATPIHNPNFTTLSPYECGKIEYKPFTSVEQVLKQWHTHSEYSQKDMWWERATLLLTTAAKLAQKTGDLSISGIRDYLKFSELMNIYTIGSADQMEVAKVYLESLPGFDATQNDKQQKHVVLEQHGYLQMQLTRFVSDTGKIVKNIDNIHVSIDDENSHGNLLFGFLDRWLIEQDNPIVVFDGCWGSKQISQMFLNRISKIEHTTQLYIGYYISSDFENEKLYEQILARIDTDNRHKVYTNQ